MYALFYILAYLAIIGFCCLAVLKIRDYLKASPLHIRWELYPVPHEGPERAAYGGSYMEDTNWWTKRRHADHWMDIKSMAEEIFFLKATYDNNRNLWIRSYPFHMGLYLLMGGTMLLVFTAIVRLFGVCPECGFIIFLNNVINVMSAFGAFLIACGGTALIIYRLNNAGLRKYTTSEMLFNLSAFVVFALLTICAWIFNPSPSYAEIANNFIYNLFTANFKSLDSGWFVLNMLAGFVVLLWIPVTNMRHLLIKYFMYHDIRWGDTATVWSKKNQEIIPGLLKTDVTWAAEHVTGEGEKTWGDVATSNPAVAPEKK